MPLVVTYSVMQIISLIKLLGFKKLSLKLWNILESAANAALHELCEKFILKKKVSLPHKHLHFLHLLIVIF